VKRLLFFPLIVLLTCCSEAQPDLPLTCISNVNSFKSEDRKPLLLMLHGYGADERDLFGLSNSIAPGFLVFSARGPVSTQHGGFCWFDLGFLPEQKFSYDYVSARNAAEKVAGTIRELKKRKDVDTTKVFLLGFSQGAILGYDIIVHHPGLVKGLVALSGAMMSETMRNVSASIRKPLVFSAHGKLDDVVKFSDGKAAADFLSAKQLAEVSFREYQSGHNIPPETVRDIRQWLDEKD
jgi:phospholipase/carboxylesterase